MAEFSAKKRRTVRVWLKRTLLAIIVAAAGCWLISAALDWYAIRNIGPVLRASDAEGIWPSYGRSLGGDRYSPLSQINRSNVRGLREAWRYSTGELPLSKDVAGWSLQATPILVGRNLVACSHFGSVFAVDAATGKRQWKRELAVKSAAYPQLTTKCRGVSAWTDDGATDGATCKVRIIHAAGLSVYAFDATTGEPCPGFGVDGIVQVKGTPLDYPNEVSLRGPAVIVGGVAAFGSMMEDDMLHAPSGKIRAFDLRTGALRWEFDPIPREDADPASNGWGQSARYEGATNVWSIMSADPELNLIFAPTTSPSGDYFGGHRPGDNRYADSIVALDATTGKLQWHFQVVHHDLWDYDLPAQPILTDLVREGRTVPALIQLTKQGLVFVLDRRDGTALFPVEERAVPPSTVSAEAISPTQPFPTGIESIAKLGLKPQDAWGFTPIDRAACRRQIEALDNEGLFTPPSLKGTILMPAPQGGANWSGGAVDRKRNLLIVPVLQMPGIIRLTERPAGWQARPAGSLPGAGSGESSFAFQMTGAPYGAESSFLTSPLGAPCSAPPWAKLVALDLSTGKVKWEVTLGTTAAFAPMGLPLNLGGPYSGGPIATAGDIAWMAGSSDGHFRAFDLDSGKVLWSTKLPAGGMATPMTYSIDGQQYVVVAAGGSIFYPGAKGDEFVAFTLGKPQ
jgi:quinoprotein glucose dehydrogenase